MKRVLFLFLVCGLLFISPAVAEVSLRAQVEKKNITTDDYLTYKLTVSSAQRNIPTPKTPVFKGFNILSQAQSSTVVFGKGEIKTLLVYTYILVPLEPGKFKIEPSTITVKDKTYTCEEIEIEVTQTKPAPRQPEEQPKSIPQKRPPVLTGPQVTI